MIGSESSWSTIQNVNPSKPQRTAIEAITAAGSDEEMPYS